AIDHDRRSIGGVVVEARRLAECCGHLPPGNVANSGTAGPRSITSELDNRATDVRFSRSYQAEETGAGDPSAQRPDFPGRRTVGSEADPRNPVDATIRA
ncbi:hypothetical protein K2X89_05460, partial [Myxococcota bacterium]|nr:hypothetical protein [Myxococcota bacterium]